jgi:hypothetical protein
LAVCTSGLASAQYPAGAIDGVDQVTLADLRLDGREVDLDDAFRRLSDLQVWSSYPDRKVDDQCRALQRACWSRLGIRSDFAFFDDQASPSAFATPAQVLRYHNRDGCVLFGATFFDRWRDHRTDNLGAPITLIMAHEQAHIRQFKSGLDLSGTTRELHADYLSGWAFAQIAVGKDVSLKLDEGLRPIRQSHRATSEATHGNPVLREAAVRAGFDQAGRSPLVDEAVRTGLDYLGVRSS